MTQAIDTQNQNAGTVSAPSQYKIGDLVQISRGRNAGKRGHVRFLVGDTAAVEFDGSMVTMNISNLKEPEVAVISVPSVVAALKTAESQAAAVNEVISLCEQAEPGSTYTLGQAD